MGARASRRRHEGRLIRKERRIIANGERVAEEITQALTLFAEAAEEAANTISNMLTVFELGYSGLIAVREERDGSVTLGVDPGPAYPTQSRVEAGREVLSVSERVDATAARMGLDLLPWQRNLAIAALDPEAKPVQLHLGGRKGGKTVVQKVVTEISGPDAPMGWVDEILDLPG